MSSRGSTPPRGDPGAPGGGSLYAQRYVLGPVLGRGGTCSVYRAWDTRLQRYVAIKRLEPPLTEDPHIRARFDREGRAIARLSHPNLVTLIDRGSLLSEEYMVFEYVEGRSLKELIARTGPLEPRDAGQIAGQIAEGLSHAHLAGIVHRDVKPQNILLDAEGRAKLTDFGIATGADLTQVTQPGAIVGSGRYMSPEQVQGRPVDPRSDLYSLGIVLYEMLAGEPPFTGTSIADIGRQHVRARPRPLHERRADLAGGLERVVMRCLEKLPENRFQSMDELLGALIGLGLYQPPRGGGGIFGPLRRSGRGRSDSLSDSREWVPPPGMEVSLRRTEIMAERRNRRKPRIPLRMVAVAVVVMAVAAAGFFLTRPPDAPDLAGKTLDEAKAAAQAAGLQLEARLVTSLQPPYGIVTGQDPAPGEAAGDGLVRVDVTREPVAVSVTAVDDSDPEGDKEERPELLARLTDGDPETSWSTEVYRSATFGGRKKGVGVSFALETAALLLEVVSPDEGWAGEVQAAGSDGKVTTVAKLTGAKRQIVELGRPTRAGRIWITRLAPASNDRYATRIAELRFYR
ncbi:MAG: Stk1 family PASTA domain-containing Ser/Thr kinase [Thermoleophilia bacterium]